MTEAVRDDHDCELTDEDPMAALKEMGVYLDVTVRDLKTIYCLAQEKVRQRKREQGRQENTTK